MEWVAIMDRFPATPGHALVLPKDHIEDIFTISEGLAARLMGEAVRLAKAIQQQLNPVGLNLVQANGTQAGQTIRHFHLHVLPRYLDDTVVLRFGHREDAASWAQLERLAVQIMTG